MTVLTWLNVVDEAFQIKHRERKDFSVLVCSTKSVHLVFYNSSWNVLRWFLHLYDLLITANHGKCIYIEQISAAFCEIEY